MNYYTDFRNGCYMNNKDECCNDYSKNNDTHYNFDNVNNYNRKRGCCVRKVEETICCYPSYYNEEKEDKKDEHFYPCYEGIFTLCPRKSYCYNKEDNKQDSCYKDDKKYENRNNKCCFCRLFSRW